MPQIEVVVPACVGPMIVTKHKNKRKVKVRELTYLNLNKYRNWNGFFEAQVKKKFYKLVLEEFLRIPRMKFINQIEYTLIVPSKRKRDRMNVYSIVDKYFCDALQFYNKIKDDDDSTIGDFIFKQSSYMKDKDENIRVSIKIVYDEI